MLWNTEFYYLAYVCMHQSFMTDSFQTESQNDWLRSLQGYESKEDGKCLSVTSFGVNACSFYFSHIQMLVVLLLWLASVRVIQSIWVPWIFHASLATTSSSVVDQTWTIWSVCQSSKLELRKELTADEIRYSWWIAISILFCNGSHYTRNIGVPKLPARMMSSTW